MKRNRWGAIIFLSVLLVYCQTILSFALCITFPYLFSYFVTDSRCRLSIYRPLWLQPLATFRCRLILELCHPVPDRPPTWWRSPGCLELMVSMGHQSKKRKVIERGTNLVNRTVRWHRLIGANRISIVAKSSCMICKMFDPLIPDNASKLRTVGLVQLAFLNRIKPALLACRQPAAQDGLFVLIYRWTS